MRIDLYLAEKGLARSRTEAKSLVEEGCVFVDGKPITKPALDVSPDCNVEVKRAGAQYVSRGGYKLEAALDAFSVSPLGRLAIDIGASSGGFTDCLLQRGAKRVVAVDSGTMQLSSVLREDERVTVMENTNARYLTDDDLPFKPSLAVMDVSFISATYLTDVIYNILDEGSDFVCLIKPQFEVGRAGLSKNGIVKDDKWRKAACDKVIASAEHSGFAFEKIIKSPVVGGDGNIEFLALFKK